MRYSVSSLCALFTQLAVMLLFGGVAFGQVGFTVAQPEVDSFPIIRIPVSVTVGGVSAPSLNASNFALSSDGHPIQSFTLSDCDVPVSAAIAIVVDTSGSMKQSASSGLPPNFSYSAFRSCFSSLVSRIPTGSLFTVVPFADSATYSYPTDSPYFYQSANFTDTTALLQVLKNLRFDSAGTFVNAGVQYAAQLLRTVPSHRRVIVLVTDDFLNGYTELEDYLLQNSISLYVMQLHPDPRIIFRPNEEVARKTSGAYLEAPDTSYFAPIMATIADAIFQPHCILRYLDSANCPWSQQHQVQVTLNYRTTLRMANASYSIGPNAHDTIPPALSTTSPATGVEIVNASKDYPCHSAIKTISASGLANFVVRSTSVDSGSASIQLAVIDSLYPATANVTAVDLLGNFSTIGVQYVPLPDTVAPRIKFVQQEPGVFTIHVGEDQPWDRGVRSVLMEPGALNVVRDFVRYYRRDSVDMVLHVQDATTPALVCIVATDSVGNASDTCLTYTPPLQDILPPVLTQDPIAEPIIKLAGTVTEHRKDDSGIRDCLTTMASNTGFGQNTIVDSRTTQVSANILDSMYRAVVYVRAVDSAGNVLNDSLVYQPLPDALAPQVFDTVSTNQVFVTATEVRGWDRGLKSVTFLPAMTNVSVSNQSYSDAHHWNASLTISDTAKDSQFEVVAIDSAGNVTHQTVTIPARPSDPIAYMGDLVVDFGTHLLPITARQSVTIKNTNPFAVSVIVADSVGDDSVFTMVARPKPFPLSANNSEVLTFDWHPTWAGRWKLVYTLTADGQKTGTITLLGVSIGQFSLNADTVAVIPGGQVDTLHVRIASTPSLLNVDSIWFTVQYDPDIALLGAPTQCSSSNLCPYNLSYQGDPGAMRIALTRPRYGLPLSFSADSSVISIPVQTYVSTIDRSVVWFSDMNTNIGPVTDTSDGLIISLDTCGTPLIRTAMRGEPLLTTIAVTPNPAAQHVNLLVRAAHELTGQLEWVNEAGLVVSSQAIILPAGATSRTISTAPSGSYILCLLADGDRVWLANVVVSK